MDDTRIVLDDQGFPVLLAAKGERDKRPPPGAGVLTPTASGNDAHDPGTGKFGFKSTSQDEREAPSRSALPKPPAPPSVDDEFSSEVARRFDAIRDAAREFDDFELGDLDSFLAGRTVRDLTPEEKQQFILDVKEMRMADLVDILDQNLRRKVLGRSRGTRFVRVQAPRGFTRRSLVGLEDPQILQISNRLRARGWTDEDLSKQLIKRFDGKRQPALAGLVGVDVS